MGKISRVIIFKLIDLGILISIIVSINYITDLLFDKNFINILTIISLLFLFKAEHDNEKYFEKKIGKDLYTELKLLLILLYMLFFIFIELILNYTGISSISLEGLKKLISLQYIVMLIMPIFKPLVKSTIKLFKHNTNSTIIGDRKLVEMYDDVYYIKKHKGYTEFTIIDIVKMKRNKRMLSIYFILLVLNIISLIFNGKFSVSIFVLALVNLCIQLVLPIFFNKKNEKKLKLILIKEYLDEIESSMFTGFIIVYWLNFLKKVNILLILFSYSIAIIYIFKLLMLLANLKLKWFDSKKEEDSDELNLIGLIKQGDGKYILLDDGLYQYERDLYYSISNNSLNKATLLSGPWGSGKTYTINKLFSNFKQVDLLLYGSGQNLFYSTYKALSKRFALQNIKINFVNLLNNPELLYILILVNLSLIPFITIINDPKNNLDLILLIVTIINIFAIWLLPSIVLSKDLNNNRFRKMYLDLIEVETRGEIVVFENLDRLTNTEIIDVLEIVNYLNEREVGIIITADMDYLRNEIKNYKDSAYNKNFFNRYFKDIVYMPTDYARKVQVFIQLLAKNKIFIAPYEKILIAEVINRHGSQYNIRELEYIIYKYKSKTIQRQFSFELFMELSGVSELKGDAIYMWEIIISKCKDIGDYEFITRNDMNFDLLYQEKYKYSYMALISYIKDEYGRDIRAEKKLTENEKEKYKLSISDNAIYFSLTSLEEEIYKKIINSSWESLNEIILEIKEKKSSSDKVLQSFKSKFANLFSELSDKNIDNILCKVYIECYIYCQED